MVKNNSKAGSGWIPCMERIPKNNQKVLACTRKGHIDIRIFRIETVRLNEEDFGKKYKDNEKDIEDYSFHENLNPECLEQCMEWPNAAVNSPAFSEFPNWDDDPVLAWMPMPKRYKEE